LSDISSVPVALKQISFVRHFFLRDTPNLAVGKQVEWEIMPKWAIVLNPQKSRAETLSTDDNDAGTGQIQLYGKMFGKNIFEDFSTFSCCFSRRLFAPR
jgi:hypothetical protein